MELLPLSLELALEFIKVFDDAIVNKGELASIGKVGVSIGIGGRTVGRPTSMADAGGALGYGLASSSSRNTLSFPAFLCETKEFPGTTIAMPAESYPRYSKRAKPPRTTSDAER